MCGLVGMAGDISYEMRTKTFRDMLDVCQVRGRDSTGVIAVMNNQEYDWSKQVGPPSALVDTRTYEQRIERKTVCALIGHTRSKTVGDISVKNAHPFDFPDEGICGVHNGTLRGYHNLDTHAHGKVDSEVLYGHMAHNGVEDTFKNVEGAYACVWWNAKEKTLNFFRNDQRPLWFTWSDDLKTMFWASECWMFGSVSRKTKLWDGGDSGKIFHELPIHTLWSFRINPVPKEKDGEKYLTLCPIKEIKPEEKKVTPAFRPPYRYHHGAMDDIDADDGWEPVGNGAWVRQKTGTQQNQQNDKSGNVTNVDKGGSVPRPFPGPPFNDPLPVPLLEGGLHIGKENSHRLDVDFLRNSITNSASSTEGKPSTSSQKKKLSLVSTNSPNSPQDNSGGNSGYLGPLSGKSPQPITRGVSLRTILGVQYVSAKGTSMEWRADNFLKQTGGECCHCREKVQKVEQVGEILSSSKFICVDCLKEPAIPKLAKGK